MKCKEAMSTACFEARPDTPAEVCAQLMREDGVGFLPVVDSSGVTVGVVTDRDLVLRVLAARRPADTPVSQVMTPGPFITCLPDDELSVLEQRMIDGRKSRALVQNATGKTVGVISLSDIAQVEPSVARVGQVVRDVTDRESSLLGDP